MKCPSCNILLTMTERQGVEIDYCTQCRGVWLDRGELDKIIERSAQYGNVPQAAETPRQRESSYGQTYAPAEQANRGYEYERREKYDDDYNEHGKGRKRKREGFLSELFDFD